LVAEVSGFEELMRVRIAATVSQAVREVERSILEDWLDLRGEGFEKFVGGVCGWEVGKGGMVKVPMNKENEAKGTVVRENVKFDRKVYPKSHEMMRSNIDTWFAEFSRVVRRAYEQPA